MRTQYILNIDAIKEAETKIQALIDSFSKVDSPEARERTKFLFDNLAMVRAAIQASFKFKSDPRHTISAVFRHTDKTGRIASVSLFKQSKSAAKRMTSPGASTRLNVGPTGKITRYLSARTDYIRSLRGEDRAFILRMHNSGTDVRTAHADVHGRGTYGTWGARGSIGAQNAVERASGKMEQLAQKYGDFITIQASEILN